MISINRTALERGVYDAVRFAWKLTPSEANKAKIILATVQGVIKGVFVAEQWFKPHKKTSRTLCCWVRMSIITKHAQKDMGSLGKMHSRISDQVLGKRIPEKFRKKGASNPIKYSWKAKD